MNENKEKRYIGEVIDFMIDAQTGEKTQIRPMSFNLVVDDCSKLIAALMKGQAGYGGVKFFAVGRGSNNWSNENPPTPDATASKLTNECYRKAIGANDVVFIDAANVVSANPTNRIQITVTFEETEANGELREIAIFGGNATSTANSGLMINCKNHPLIYKTTGMRLQRVIRFTF